MKLDHSLQRPTVPFRVSSSRRGVLSAMLRAWALSVMASVVAVACDSTLPFARGDERPANAMSAAAPQSLSIAPGDIELRGPRAYQQVLVTGHFAENRAADFTRLATFTSNDPSIVTVNAQGVVIPHADGATTITGRWRELSAQVQVTVSGMSEPAPIDFRTEVIAALSRAGCNQGACHGSPQGKDGFRLSLRGYDPDLDFLTLRREDGARRVNTLQPDSSLILLKGLGRVPHQGGRRFAPDDAVHQTLRRWIAEGGAAMSEPRELESFETLPSSRALESGFPEQQLTVRAKFADGAVGDVSRLAVFSTRLDPAVEVTEDGLVRFRRTGEATILVRYLQQVRSVHLTYVERDPQFVFRAPEPVNFVDQQVFAKQRSLQLNPAPLADDATFLRRVYLDTIATLPTTAEAREFLDSKDPNKRTRLIDRLLERDEFAPFWALKWADVMRGNRTTISQRGVHSLHRYLVASFAEDRPFDQLARELITGQGNTLHRPAANFFRISPTPEEAAESFAQLFLGVRVQCAKCHNHPFESLTQGDYYGLAAYFARVRIKGKQFGSDDETVYVTRQGEVQHPLTRKNLEPVAFGTPAGPIGPDDDRRELLANWLTHAGHRSFARSTVNRIWFHLLGRGIVDPVDDFRETNPPSHPELLDALADEFVRGGYRFKPVIRTILNSQTYQRSARVTEPQSPLAADPARYYVRATVRMLTGEQTLDAISAAVGLPERFRGYPPGTRAIELAEGAVDNDFLMAFSRPLRDAACDCAREDEPSLNEVLHLLNNSDLVKKIEAPASHLGRWLAAGLSDREILENVYLASLSRRPTNAEIELAEQHLQSSGDRAVAFQDWQHALINSNEFLLRH